MNKWICFSRLDVNLVKQTIEILALKDSLIDLMKGD